MRCLVDTNVISELCKKDPNANVLAWLSETTDDLYLSVITVEEMRFGELMMPKGKRRDRLHEIIDQLFAEFATEILTFDADAASQCAVFHERAIHLGRTPTFEDLAIAAIAQTKEMVVVTRNVSDFDYLGVEVFDPFEHSAPSD